MFSFSHDAGRSQHICHTYAHVNGTNLANRAESLRDSTRLVSPKRSEK